MMSPSETTIETVPVAPNDADRFSWRRVWLIGRYMIPTFRKQLIMYPIVITLFTLSSELFYHIGWMQLMDAGIFSTLCGFMFYFAPVSLARKNNRFIMAQIPARTSEKFVFLLIYYWIVIGILTLGLNKLITIIMTRYMDGANIEAEAILTNLTNVIGLKLTYIMIMGYFSALALQAFALYGVVKAKSSRMMTAIGYSLGGYVLMCVISGLAGAFMAGFYVWKMRSSFGDGGSGSIDADELASGLVVDIVPTIMSVVTILLSVVAVVLLCKTYKIIRHRGF